MGCLKTQNFNSVRIPNRRIGFWGTKRLQLSHLICCLDICFFQHWDEIFVLAVLHRLSPTATHQNPKKNETTSQPFTNMFKRTWSHARKAGFVMTTWGIFLRGFSNLQLGKTHFTTWFRSFHPAANNSYEMIPLNSTTSACELARVSNMARTRASLRWNVSPMAFSSCSTSWLSSCWFWIQKNQHFLP